jgi:hypothetical protein
VHPKVESFITLNNFKIKRGHKIILYRNEISKIVMNGNYPRLNGLDHSRSCNLSKYVNVEKRRLVMKKSLMPS